jgi:hypothetical protein
MYILRLLIGTSGIRQSSPYTRENVGHREQPANPTRIAKNELFFVALYVDCTERCQFAGGVNRQRPLVVKLAVLSEASKNDDHPLPFQYWRVMVHPDGVVETSQFTSSNCSS